MTANLAKQNKTKIDTYDTRTINLPQIWSENTGTNQQSTHSDDSKCLLQIRAALSYVLASSTVIMMYLSQEKQWRMYLIKSSTILRT